MKKQFKTIALASIALGLFACFSSCSKDDPAPEIPQEEVGRARLTFTEVAWHGDHADDLENPEVVEVEFDAQGLPPVGAHLHLNAGKTYRLELTTYDFAGRESQHEFVNEAHIHQVFLLGAPDGVLDYQYADPNNARVGITGYLHVLRASDSFIFNLILRHLNEGVKSSITADDWNNPNYTQFSGVNDLDLNVEVHVVEGDHDH
ncbi:hypothetical protein JHJ32_15795 [Parapedobacter sp. ISTM3]|uniref:hypothetical protein n=1 Tax=Parapedobacter sp. ISTM3 TaxID=2800130 RepID=UPI0019039FAF|nr:hypothetical protein [Parapedobacter sp. ISTM3]MBK1441461.1 hypothetical protein [Parapedobacter sp. ISTM3]